MKYHITTRTVVIIEDGDNYEEMNKQAQFKAHEIAKILGNSVTVSIEKVEGYYINEIELNKQ